MKTLIKEIDFDNTKSDNYHFDMVDLEDIFKRKPKDHRQFEHHKVSFYVILIISFFLRYTHHHPRKGEAQY